MQRRLESQSSFPVYAFVAGGLGVTIAEPFSAPLFARLGVTIRQTTPRIGITREAHLPLRFYAQGSPFVSGPKALSPNS